MSGLTGAVHDWVPIERTHWVWTGASLIVACGLYLIWRERVQQVETAATAAPETPAP